MSNKSIIFVWFLIGLSVFLTTACGGGESAPTATQNLDQPTDTPATATTIASTTQPPVLTSDQVFSLVSPSLAFIATPTTSGSAILIDGGYLLTNSYIVHGFEQVRVVFPDGSEFLEVPVKNSDDLIDLAVLGPIDTDIDSLKLHNREDLDIGSEVYLIAYPAADEEFPQPTIERGIISRFREWEAIGMTYIETDAAITGGQNGGALASESGEIIGISGRRFSDAGFGLVASAADVAPLADALIQGRDASILGSRPSTKRVGQREQSFFLENPWDVRTFLIDEPVGLTVELYFKGRAHGLFTVLDPFGRLLLAGETGTPELESGSFRIETIGLYSVQVGLASGFAGQLTLSGDVDLIPVDDPDDGVAISIGDLIAGNIDFIGDLDYFLLDLEEGDAVEIRVESMNIDANLLVDFPGSRADQVLNDDDSGGGPFGIDSKMIYRSIRTGVHYLAVNDAALVKTGGYLISVNLAPADMVAVEPPPFYETVDSPFGSLIVFKSSITGFSVLAPADWTPGDSSQPGTELVLVDNDNNLVIVVEDILAMGAGEATLEQYSDLVVSIFKSQIPGFELLSRENIQTSQGLDAMRLEYLAVDGSIHGSRLIHLDENNVAVNITVHAKAQEFEDLRGMFDYIFDSFSRTISSPTGV